jgi:hypothetical protein
LEAGCYFFVVSAEGYETFVSTEECLEPGETLNNPIDLVSIVDATPTGNLIKALVIPNDVIVDQINDGVASLQTEVLFCQGVITDPADCNELTDDAVVTHGGFDDYQGVPFFTFPDIDLDDLLQEFGIFVFAAQVPVGDYTICTGVEITWDDDADPTTPDVELDSGFNCENESDLQIIGTGLDDFELAEGQIVVEEDMTTIVVNVFSPLDVYVRDDETDLPIAGAEVCLFDSDDMLVSCAVTDAAGIARFYWVGDGTYTANADATFLGYESEATVFTYNIFDDIDNGGPIDDALTADVVQSLDPDVALVGGFLDAYVSIGGLDAQGVTVTVYVSDAADTLGANGNCVGASVASGVTDANGEADFGLTAGTYCVEATGTAGTVETSWTATFSVAAGEPDEDLALDPTLADTTHPFTAVVPIP